MENIELIKQAVLAQAEDEGLWAITDRITEAYLQESLRDLHLVIENSDMEAFSRIKNRIND